MINELERKRLELYDMKSKFEDQGNRVKGLIVNISDNKEAAVELSDLLFQLGGDVERVNNALKDNKRALDTLYKAKSLS